MMTTQERLAEYKAELAKLEQQRRELLTQLDVLDDLICEKKVEVAECEAYLLYPEYPEN